MELEPTSTQKGPDEPEQNTSLSTPVHEFEIKHPLQFAWSWWYDNPGKSWKTNQNSKWEDNLKKIYTFDTVEDFWCLWNNIKGANELPLNSNYHVFKDGIEPKWEDAVNKNGGKWIIQKKKFAS